MIIRSRSRSTRRWAALAAGLTLVVTACGGDDDDSGGGTEAPTVTEAAGVTEAPAASDAPTVTTEATDTDATTADGAAPAETTPGGTTAEPAAECTSDATLRYGAVNVPSRLDPHRSSNGYDQNWLAPVYDRLIHQTPEEVELEPSLATEWEFTDDVTFEMTLRDDVTFSDGTPFDADAVVANIERAKTVEGTGVAAYLARVDTVEAVDPTHVRFTLSSPDATLPNQLATRPGMMMSPAAMANTDLDTNPVGSGPYTLVEYRDSEVAIYERNPDYWNPDFVGPAKLEIYYFPDSNTRLNALRTGQVDAAVVAVELIEEVEGMDDLNVDVYDTIETYHFQPDRTKSEFGDPLVRRALSHAIDRDAVVEGLMFGYATPATQWVAEGTPSYVDELGDSTTYDVDRARELLAEAGLPDGFSFDAMTGVQPTFTRLAEILQGQFAEIGVTMNVTQDPQLADAFFVRNVTDAIVSAYPGRVDPSETAQIYFNDESFSNPGREIAPEVKEAWLASLIPGDDRPERLQDLVREIDIAMPNVPILYPQVGLGYTDQVEGLQWYRSGHIEFAGVCPTD